MEIGALGMELFILGQRGVSKRSFSVPCRSWLRTIPLLGTLRGCIMIHLTVEYDVQKLSILIRREKNGDPDMSI